MLYATTSTIQGREVEPYLGVVVFGDAVLGSNNGMLMVSASGTAVRLRPAAGGGPWSRPAG